MNHTNTKIARAAAASRLGLPDHNLGSFALFPRADDQDETLAVADCGDSPHCRRVCHSVCPCGHGTKERARPTCRFLPQGDGSRNRHDGRVYVQLAGRAGVQGQWVQV